MVKFLVVMCGVCGMMRVVVVRCWRCFVVVIFVVGSGSSGKSNCIVCTDVHCRIWSNNGNVGGQAKERKNKIYKLLITNNVHQQTFMI